MRLFLVPAFSLALALPASAQEAPIQDTIQSQITAFLADDLAGAFSFASPNIKTIFGSSDNFGLMVQRAYPMVYRPSAVQMGDLREVAGALWQRVYVTDAQRRAYALDYQMIETDQGWKINAVQLLPGTDLGA